MSKPCDVEGCGKPSVCQCEGCKEYVCKRHTRLIEDEDSDKPIRACYLCVFTYDKESGLFKNEAA